MGMSSTNANSDMKHKQTCITLYHVPLIKTVRNLTFLELVVYDYTYYQERNCLGPSHYFLKQEYKYLIHSLYGNISFFQRSFLSM